MRQESSGRGVEPLKKHSSTGLCASISHALLSRSKLSQSAGLSCSQVSVQICMSSASMTLEILFSGFMSCPDDGVRILV